ncbi:acetyl-CoA acetyltransferase [Sphingomonas jinjuensis]|uniref:Acetyl-CoA acetyltransferase n=1 Tax=Sphingomonas jinjuensis TaxID=535907 RepID=A0A840FC14_9SPHN|nr:transporter [Sphingomonas jinjuensis]MBB4155550.1 acetyl-CoA acetyltransferase [Sphingomonas jinjuensis]
MSLRGKTAIVGIGQTPYYKRGTAPDPEQKLALRAIVAACEDAGIDPRDIDGFVSYGSERNTGQQMLPALGLRDLRFAALAWTHGGGIPGALTIAAAAIVSGQAEIVVVHRAMAEGSNQRLQVAVTQDETPAQFLVNGVDFILARSAQRAMRLIHEGVPQECFEAIARAGYFHAQNNPGAMGHGHMLTLEAYAASRWIGEPLHLYDCSRESDAAAAVVLVSAERARDLRQKPAYLLSAPMGAGASQGSREDNHEPYTSVGMIGLADRLWRESGYGPSDVDVAQVYENFTPMAAMALIDHGFCTRESAGDVLTFDNLIAPAGKLPINTSGGNIADGFIHGMGLLPEAVRQIRGTSTNQVPGARLSLMTGGPGDSLTSTALLGSDETL